MPTFIPNTDAITSLDNSAGSLTDYSDEISMMSIDAAFSNGEFFTFGLGVQVTEGLRRYTGSITYRPAEGGTSLHNTMMTWAFPGAGNKMGSKTVRVSYPDAAAGAFQIDGEILPDSANLANQDAAGDGAPASHAVPFKFTAEPTFTLIT